MKTMALRDSAQRWCKRRIAELVAINGIFCVSVLIILVVLFEGKTNLNPSKLQLYFAVDLFPKQTLAGESVFWLWWAVRVCVCKFCCFRLFFMMWFCFVKHNRYLHMKFNRSSIQKHLNDRKYIHHRFDGLFEIEHRFNDWIRTTTKYICWEMKISAKNTINLFHLIQLSKNMFHKQWRVSARERNVGASRIYHTKWSSSLCVC